MDGLTGNSVRYKAHLVRVMPASAERTTASVMLPPASLTFTHARELSQCPRTQDHTRAVLRIERLVCSVPRVLRRRSLIATGQRLSGPRSEKTRGTQPQ